MTSTAICFLVPFDEKDSAKTLGARWNPDLKVWYAPTPEVAAAMAGRWKAIEDTRPITALPGEDRQFGTGLFVDLIPRSCWFTNVRYCLAPEDWTRLSLGIRERASQSCEICGASKADGAVLEAHERWDYQDNGVQVLKRLVCVCQPCHRVTHYGLSKLKGLEEACVEHWRDVNGAEDLDAHLQEAWSLWEHRNLTDWTLDLSIIESAGLTIVRPVPYKDRQRIATEELDARLNADLENQLAHSGGFGADPFDMQG